MKDRIITVKSRSDLLKVKEYFDKKKSYELGDFTNEQAVFSSSKETVTIKVSSDFGKIEVGDIVNHFKNNKYKILSKCKDHETAADCFIYQALYPPYDLWVRPISMFNDIVDFSKYPNSNQAYRFIKVTPED